MVGVTKTGFAVIGGSRSLGTNHATSDIDLLIVSGSQRKIENKDGYNIIYWPADQFISAFSNAENGYSHIYQFLYPEDFLSTGELTDWVKSNRDSIIAENRDVLYHTISSYFFAIESKLTIYYKIAIKRVVYIMCYGKMICSYADGINLSDCFCAKGEWRNTLLKALNNRLTYDEVASIVSELHEKIQSVSSFFEPTASKSVTNELKERFLTSEFMNYNELKEGGLIPMGAALPLTDAETAVKILLGETD